MFEVDVKNVTEEGREEGEGRGGPARVWGSDVSTVQNSTVQWSTAYCCTVQYSTVVVVLVYIGLKNIWQTTRTVIF